MGWLATLERPTMQAVTPGPFSDHWYQPVGTLSTSGMTVSETTANRIATYWRCKAVLSDSVGMLPMHVYRRVKGGGKTRAWDTWQYRLLHTRPNGYQSPIEFFGEQMGYLLDGGNAMSLKRPGVTGDIEELWPLSPERTKIEVMRDRTMRFLYREADNTTTAFSAEQVWHVKRWARDGLGRSVLSHARDSLGLTMALEGHASATFKNSARPGSVIEHPGKLSLEAMRQFIAKFNANHQGVANAGKLTILDEDAKIHTVGMNNEDAQLLAMRQFQREDVAAWFGIPPHLLGYLTGQTSWGTGIESLSLLFLIYTLTPYLVTWEQSASLEFLDGDDTLFAEFLVDALLRGDAVSRSQAMSTQIHAGILTPNEGRAAENRNPAEGGDQIVLPVNLTPASKLGQTPVQSPQGGAPVRDAVALAPFVRDAAARMARREAQALGKAARRVAGDPQAWAQAVSDFYSAHMSDVGTALRVRPETAIWYVQGQEQSAAELGPDFAAIEATWEGRATAYLAGLALNDHGMGDLSPGDMN